MAVKLGTSFDVVEAVRSLATDQQSLQEIVAALEARVQVLERPAAPRPLIQVGDLVADEQPAAPGPEVALRLQRSRCGASRAKRRSVATVDTARRRERVAKRGSQAFPLFVAEVSMEILIRDARFWVALLLLIRSVLFYVVPAFPEQIWVAIDTFVGVVLGILAGNNVVQTRRSCGRGSAVSSRPGGAP